MRSLIAFCGFMGIMDPIQPQHDSNLTSNPAVIAFAYGAERSHMTFCGLVGIMDPPRVGVNDAIEDLHASGTSLKMLTGDSRDTAIAVG